jgi:hypothetical protein
VELTSGQIVTVDWRRDPLDPAQDPQPSEPNKLGPAATAQAAGCPRHWGLELMARRSYSDGSRGDEQLIRQLPALLRQHRPDLMQGEKLYRSPPGFTSWSGH